MKILVTGGTGLIGRELVPRLRERGHRVTVLTRRRPPPDASDPSIRYLCWSPPERGEWYRLVGEQDAIIHLAGESIGGQNLRQILFRRWTPEVKRRIWESRVLTGRLLTEAIGESWTKPQVFLQASAVGYYGNRGVQERLTEESSPGHGFLAEVCRQWEASTAEIEREGVRRVILRTGLVLAPHGGILPVMALPFRLFLGGPLGSGQQGISWIHLTDHVRAVLALVEDPSATGPFNLVSPNPVSQHEFSRTLCRLLRRPCWFPTPERVLRLWLGEKASLLLEGQYVLPKRLSEKDFCFRYPQLEEALRACLIR